LKQRVAALSGITIAPSHPCPISLLIPLVCPNRDHIKLSTPPKPHSSGLLGTISRFLPTLSPGKQTAFDPANSEQDQEGPSTDTMVGASRSESKSKSQSVEVIEPTSMEVDGEQQEANGNGLNDAQEEGEEEQDDDLPAGDDKGVEAGEDDDEEEEEEGEFEVEAIVDHRAGDAAVGCVREPKAKMGLTRSSFRYPKSYLFALLPDACDKSTVRRANTNVGDCEETIVVWLIIRPRLLERLRSGSQHLGARGSSVSTAHGRHIDPKLTCAGVTQKISFRLTGANAPRNQSRLTRPRINEQDRRPQEHRLLPSLPGRQMAERSASRPSKRTMT
jgi:hypothetical protein